MMVASDARQSIAPPLRFQPRTSDGQAELAAVFAALAVDHGSTRVVLQIAARRNELVERVDKLVGRQGAGFSVRPLVRPTHSAAPLFQGPPRVLLTDRRPAPRTRRPALPDQSRCAAAAESKRWRGWIAAHPDATIISVSQNDRDGYCECDNCRRVEQEEGGAHSGPLLRYVNALAEAIEKKTLPDAYRYAGLSIHRGTARHYNVGDETCASGSARLAHAKRILMSSALTTPTS